MVLLERLLGYGWPYSTPSDQPNFSVHFRLFVQKVNKQNCRIWCLENPNVIIEKPMHPQRVCMVRIFVMVASLGHFSSKMSKEPPLRSMASVTVSCSTNFCFQKLKRMTWTTFGFNRTEPLATQPT